MNLMTRSIIAIKRRINKYKDEQLNARIQAKRFGVIHNNQVAKLNARIEELEWVIGKKEFL